MENTMNTSEKIGQLAGALAEAQTQFKPVLKDSDNPYFNSKYADLATVIAATQPALAKNGLVVIQSPIVDTAEEKAGVVTVLAHSSGEWLSHELVLPATMKAKDGNSRFDAQSVGSAITYARRYSYQAIVGCAAEVDDDGNAASQGTRERTPSKAKAATVQESVTLTPYKEGFVALSGKGLAIVRSNIDNKMMAELGWKWEGSVAVIPAKNGFKFVDLCAKNNVGTTWMDAQAGQHVSEERPLAPPKANIPPPPQTYKGQDTNDEPESNGNDPIITSAKRVKGSKPGAKEFLSVEWNGKKASCWDKKYWVHIEHYVGRPAMLMLQSKGQYVNVTGIERLDGENYEDSSGTE